MLLFDEEEEHVTFVFLHRRTLYPPWRILRYLTFQARMLMMELAPLLEAKEKLLGIGATL